MFNSIVRKTIYEKRWSLAIWYVGLFATTVLIMLLFPTLRDTFGKALNDVPESIRGILGDASTYQRIEGFIDIQVMAQMVFMTIIYGIILLTGVLAGDENEGTLQTLLAHPVSRTRVYVEKFIGASILVFIATSSVFTGSWLGAAVVGESIDLVRLGLATGMLFLVTMAFSAIGFALGAITGKRGIAGAAAGSIAFISYLITNLAPSVSALQTVNKFSPYEYFNKPSILDNGVQAGDVMILLGITVACVIAGYVAFVRRDIPQK